MSEQGAELLEPAAAPAGPVTATAQPVFCLIVDDEKSLRNLLARVLRQRMVMTEECGDAAEALRAIKNRTPDLVFLDVSLERSDAIEVIRGLGEMRFPGQIQLMSGRDLTLLHDVKRVGERHALKMLPPLQKPFRFDVIADVLREAGLSRAAPNSGGKSLFEALCGGWLELCYQPTLELRTTQLVGAEGLARVNHPQHGVLMPAAFLPGAEEASLLALAEFAVLAALRDWHEFAEAGAPLRLSVNIPLDALMRLPIAALVREHRPSSSSWPGLTLEVSEDQLLRDIKLVYEIATQLSIYNVYLAIDRFGYAHNVLTSLLELPHVELKLARGFVAGCTEDKVKRQLCESVVQLAHKYKHQVVAVGIDQRDDLQTLTRMGCDLGQGMLLGPPLPKDKIVKMIKIRGGRQSA